MIKVVKLVAAMVMPIPFLGWMILEAGWHKVTRRESYTA
jgi:hypothetical protein